MKIKASDYIVQYLIEQVITDVFGYPGGMVTHLMDSLGSYREQIQSHVLYHEQGVSFAACGYAQVTGKTGVAYATSGPGATNMITGICHAYYDSIPVLFITGQVNTFESNDGYHLRQRGFQETNVIQMVQGVTKYAAYVQKPEQLKLCLDRAFQLANEGRKGPVLLDIPMNVQRAILDTDMLESELPPPCDDAATDIAELVQSMLTQAKRPCLFIGNGVYSAGQQDRVRALIEKWGIPVVSSLLAFDIAPAGSSIEPYYYGFIGAYGERCANFVAAKCDLLITLGARLDVRQVGAQRERFAPDAKIIRIDIDQNELDYPVHHDDINLCLSLEHALNQLLTISLPTAAYTPWRSVCDMIRKKLAQDRQLPGDFIRAISRRAPGNSIVTADVGQNEVWIAQSFIPQKGQRILIPGGHAAMGCSLPTAIGAHIGSRKTVLCFSGDGGIQMNIQELQTVVRENMPIKIIVMNNHSLGMIRHFQEMYFQCNYVQTTSKGGYTVPDFCAVATAYGIRSRKIQTLAEVEQIAFGEDGPECIEVLLPDETYVTPKLVFGQPNQDQDPPIDRALYRELMDL